MWAAVFAIAASALQRGIDPKPLRELRFLSNIVCRLDVCFQLGHFLGRQVVCQLQRAGYSVTYNRFQGQHVLPSSVAGGMVAWFLGLGASNSSASPLCPGST